MHLPLGCCCFCWALGYIDTVLRRTGPKIVSVAHDVDDPCMPRRHTHRVGRARSEFDCVIAPFSWDCVFLARIIRHTHTNYWACSLVYTVIGTVLSALKVVLCKKLLDGNYDMHPVDLLARVSPLAFIQTSIMVYLLEWCVYSAASNDMALGLADLLRFHCRQELSGEWARHSQEGIVLFSVIGSGGCRTD